MRLADLAQPFVIDVIRRVPGFQVFQGSVIRLHRGTTGGTFTVRKISEGVGVERVFPMNSPFIDHVDVVTRGRVRRSRLYYLRQLKGKAARIKPRGNY